MKDQFLQKQTIPPLKYQQIVIPAATHSFSGQETNLVKRIAGWVQQNALSHEIAESQKRE
jgi:hypothetical protein